MCGIVGYVGKKKCTKIILDGLSRLEYRGYDSAGIVCIDETHGHLNYTKEVGGVSELSQKLSDSINEGCIGVGHTRWATHGKPSKENAHPQFDCTNKIAVVHNGIIENHSQIRETLLETHEFRSTTDTEVVAHLLESIIEQNKNILDAIINLVSQLEGIYSLVFVLEQEPDTLIAIRNKSPLAIGIGDGEHFVASDPIAFSDQTNKTIFLPDESFSFIRPHGIEVFNFDGKKLKSNIETVDIKFSAAKKQGFAHYMLKEIYEQKKSIDNSITFYKSWGQIGIDVETITNLENIQFIAAGTSWHAGKIAQFFFEELCNLPADVQLASEFRYKKFFPKKNSLCIAISQSGETADTLECLRHVKKYGNPTVALTNVSSSTMVREADGCLLMQAGPEISVASTKAFTSQLASLYWLANQVALSKGLISENELNAAEEKLFVAAEVLESSIENYKWKIEGENKYSRYEKFIFLGRHISYPLALEAALKLKEISYIFAQAYPAGELKHGPIALIDEHTPVVVFSVLDDLIYQKLLANVQEVKARNGHVIAFAFEGQTELIKLADTVFIFPKVAPLLAPIAMTGVMQFFVYTIAKTLGHPIDKPRNLAKSVTVE
jgi:glucosamine--fructose-6-phosphate aminotransferase (isomerizing)